MSWIQYPDVDDTIHDWIKSLYTPYRNTLGEPKPIPAENMIDWDTFWAGLHETSFMVIEAEPTKHPNFALGTRTIEFQGVQTIRVTYRWIKAGKPPALKAWREFLTYTLHTSISPLPVTLRNAGIYWMIVLDSIITPQSKSAQEDYWVLEIRLATKVLNSIS